MIRLARRIAASLALFPLLFLAACSGSVSGPAATTGTLAITPQSAVVYSDVPAKFVITGGTAPYFVTSSDGILLPVPSGAFNFNTLTVIPGGVGADTSVTLSATDAKSSTSVSASVTVRPRTVSNVVTVVPSDTTCGPTSLCAGADGVITAALVQNGVALPGRAVRFDLVSGDLRFITSLPGEDEVLSTTATVTTDAFGNATVRVRALGGAPTQTALISITDVANGASVTSAVSITGVANPALAATPATIAFQGAAPNTCSNGDTATVIVTGGTPPYTISQSPAFIVSPGLVTDNPGQFTVTSTGQCTAGSLIAIVDAIGAAASVNATNSLSTVTYPDFNVSPDTVTLTACGSRAQVVLTGGTGSYMFFATGSDLISISPSGNNMFISRTSTDATGVASVTAGFSDGRTSKPVTVNFAGQAAGACP